MILVDTNVIVDIWTADPRWSEWSAGALTRAAHTEALAVNPIIFAELSVGFAMPSQLEEALSDAGFRRLPLPYRAAWLAAPLPDFFIGAHAEADGLKLLTRDPSRIRIYFPEVDLIAP